MSRAAFAAVFALGCRTGELAERLDPAELGRALDEAFRIDLTSVDVTLRVEPEVSLTGRAELRFVMRPGQQRAVFHFDPELHTEIPLVQLFHRLELDGERLDPTSPDDLVQLRFEGSTEDTFELQRALAADGEHLLVVEWAVPGGFEAPRFTGPGWVHSMVNDSKGVGNEGLFPTIDSPEELALHTVTIEVDDPRPYTAAGSGRLTSWVAPDGLQVFQFDSERPISSYTMLVAVMPAADVTTEAFEVEGVDVTVVSSVGPGKTAEAVERTRDVIGRLVPDFGPFPMPRLSVLLVDWRGGGMEYYGATLTGMGAVTHEVVHMYWGCSAVNRTWRDTWLDEAINVWWERDEDMDLNPSGYSSDLRGGRTPIEPAFDGRAYGRGSKMFADVAERAGGKDVLVEILADVHQRRQWEPYTTDELVDDLVEALDDPTLEEDFYRWVDTLDP
ncbi:MAG: hypothetical protein ABMA64_07460 [Myxococcota bacterium]